MEGIDVRMRRPYEGDSSDSSMITDDQDSEF